MLQGSTVPVSLRMINPCDKEVSIRMLLQYLRGCLEKLRLTFERCQLSNRPNEQAVVRKVPTAKKLLTIKLPSCFFKSSRINSIENDADLFRRRHSIRTKLRRHCFGNRNDSRGAGKCNSMQPA